MAQNSETMTFAISIAWWFKLVAVLLLTLARMGFQVSAHSPIVNFLITKAVRVKVA